MKKNILFLIVLMKMGIVYGQTQYGVDKALNSPTTSSPGFVFGRPAYATQNFLYNGQYINHYGSGFHDFNDGTSSIGGINAYTSSYVGIDLFTAWQRRFRINTNGQVWIDQNLWVNNGAFISSNFSDTDPNSSWSSNLYVRNNNEAINIFSRLSFVSQSGGFGVISIRKQLPTRATCFFR